MTCESCQAGPQSVGWRKHCPGIDGADGDCPHGDVPRPLTPRNQVFWAWFLCLWPGLQWPEQTWNYPAIVAFCDLHGMEPDERPVFFRRVLVVIRVVDEIRAAKAAKR